MTTSAGQMTLLRRRDVELQQFAQGSGSGPMEGGPQGVLAGLQIGASAASPLGENAAQQLIYFLCDFQMDCSSRFFS